jgi:glutathione S-transferase
VADRDHPSEVERSVEPADMVYAGRDILERRGPATPAAPAEAAVLEVPDGPTAAGQVRDELILKPKVVLGPPVAAVDQDGDGPGRRRPPGSGELPELIPPLPVGMPLRLDAGSIAGPRRVPAVLLYNSQSSGNCYKVRLLLAHLGVEYERREVDVVDRSNRRELLGDLNPALRVPTLVLDDGRPLAESGAILCYFAEGTPYMPDDRYERAQVLQWLFFEQYSHEPNIAVVRFWVAYSGVPPADAEVEAKRRAGYLALDAMERHLSDRAFHVGERFTIADMSLYAYTHVATEGGFDLSGYPAIRAWLDRVAAQPGHTPITA